jgi:hypothetical protein
MNAELIKQGISQKERLIYLRKMAHEQMMSLVDNLSVQKLSEKLMLESPSLRGNGNNTEA